VVLVDGQEHVVDAVTVSPRLVARSSLFEQLGGEVTGHVAGSYVATGPMGRTAFPASSQRGNLADLGAMLSAATGSGVTAATAINGELVAEDAAAAVARVRPRRRRRARTMRHRVSVSVAAPEQERGCPSRTTSPRSRPTRTVGRSLR
jgi:hypothetical protein